MSQLLHKIKDFKLPHIRVSLQLNHYLGRGGDDEYDESPLQPNQLPCLFPLDSSISLTMSKYVHYSPNMDLSLSNYLHLMMLRAGNPDRILISVLLKQATAIPRLSDIVWKVMRYFIYPAAMRHYWGWQLHVTHMKRSA